MDNLTDNREITFFNNSRGGEVFPDFNQKYFSHGISFDISYHHSFVLIATVISDFTVCE